jgi:hypothetical protein
MTRRAKKILPAGLAIGLMALAVSAQMAAPFSDLPLYFEADRGQADSSAQFLARGRDSQFLISPNETQIVLRKAGGLAAVRMQFIGANPRAQIRGDAALPGKVNYLTGNDPAQWHAGVPTFAKVRVEGAYPGIGLVYYGNQQQLEYDFEVAPDANPDAIKIRFDGVDKIAINAQGELILTLSDGEIRQPKPVFYQTMNGVRREISGGYRLEDAHTVVFAVGVYDHDLPLVIDPVFSYSTYFGGNNGELPWTVKVDTVGTNNFIYIAGETTSTQFSTNVLFASPGAYQTNYQSGKYAGDGFVAEFRDTGSSLELVWLTYLGGKGDNTITSLALDSSNNVYVTGYTDATNFPVFPVTNNIPGIPNSTNLSGKFDINLNTYPVDAFVAELGSSGSNLVYSAYLGGSAQDVGFDIAVDSAGNAYVTGYTSSTNFPTTANAQFLHLQCTNTAYYNCNAFVAEIAANGANLNYCSYFGGTNFDVGRGIAVDTNGFVYVTGFTASTNFPTYNPLPNFQYLNGQTNVTYAFDAFVAKFKPGYAGLVYSTFLGSSNSDMAYHIACDNAGNAYVVGATASPLFPNSATNIIANGLTNNLNNFFPVTTNAFLTEINSNGTAILHSAVFGGNATDLGYDVAVDPAGNVFATGIAYSTNFPAINTFGLLRATNSGGSDAFVIVFTNNFSAVGFSGYLGGSANDFGYGIAVDTNGNAYVVGQTLSTNFPTTNSIPPHNVFQATRNGTNDAFLAKIILTVLLPEITVTPTNQTVGVNSNATFSVTVPVGTPPFFYQWQAGGTNLVNGGSISGATSNILTITDAQTNNSGSYSVIVTNYAGSVTSSPPASLTVMYFPPYLYPTGQPTNQTVVVGSTVYFYANGPAPEPPYFLQWQKDGTDLTDGTNISGSIISNSTSIPLTIYNAQTNDDGGYTIIVTNYGGSVTSSVAILTVLTSPRFSSISVAGGTNFILGGGGGTNNGTYYVLATTNLTLPLTNWTCIATNQFDNAGDFIFTNAAQTNSPQLFYILQLP